MQAKINLILQGLIALLLIVLVAQGIHTPGSSLVGSDYQAVILDNGQAYFGKLEKLDSGWPVLKDVYYVQQRVSEDGKVKQSILVKRGGEMHRPDHMIINARQIQFIEPVRDGSKVMELIENARSRGTEKVQVEVESQQ